MTAASALAALCMGQTKWPRACLVVASCWRTHLGNRRLDAGRSVKLMDEVVEKEIDLPSPCSYKLSGKSQWKQAGWGRGLICGGKSSEGVIQVNWVHLIHSELCL